MRVDPDLTTATGRKWAALMGKTRTADDKPRRAKRFTGDHSQHKAWVREMSAGPGRFFPTGKIPNWMNANYHHHEEAKVRDVQRRTAHLETLAMLKGHKPTPPMLVTLTRYGPGPRPLDDDGLSASLKSFRDGVADALGIDDGKTDLLRFHCEQVTTLKRGFYGVRVQIASLPPAAGEAGR